MSGRLGAGIKCLYCIRNPLIWALYLCNNHTVSVAIDRKYGIKIQRFQPFAKQSFRNRFQLEFRRQVELIVAVPTTQTALRFIHGKTSNSFLPWTSKFRLCNPLWVSVVPWRHFIFCAIYRDACCQVIGGQKAILIQLKGSNPCLVCHQAMFKTWKDLAAKCALKAKGDVHFTRDYRQAKKETNRQTCGQSFLGIRMLLDTLEMAWP